MTPTCAVPFLLMLLSQFLVMRCFDQPSVVNASAPLAFEGESYHSKPRYSSISRYCSRMMKQDGRFGAASVILQVLHRTLAVKNELSHKVKLSIYRSVYVPSLTYVHELWVVTHRAICGQKVAEMKFLWRAAGLSLRGRARSSEIRRKLRVDASRTPSFLVSRACPSR